MRRCPICIPPLPLAPFRFEQLGLFIRIEPREDVESLSDVRRTQEPVCIVDHFTDVKRSHIWRIFEDRVELVTRDGDEFGDIIVTGFTGHPYHHLAERTYAARVTKIVSRADFATAHAIIDDLFFGAQVVEICAHDWTEFAFADRCLCLALLGPGDLTDEHKRQSEDDAPP
ncbi:hypothetical protein PYK22_01939 [Pyrinomonas methylaliphatogenes]|uniref:Uncharacterized protein n=1 Tax=Pyrinomonas methylaliphatogenes TaxID=454194 RepID=A0A0B6X0K1_9BACT|nr:hypothetical protein PYK22_01939 [Pyrinomonas methylaliphatogenes]